MTNHQLPTAMALIVPALSLWSAAVRAEQADPSTKGEVEPKPAAATATAARVPSPAGAKPRAIDVREIFWETHGSLRHKPMAFLDGQPLEGEELYRTLGRGDLLEEYKQRRTTRTTTIAAGGLLGLGGIIFAVAEMPRRHCSFVGTQPFTTDLVCGDSGSSTGMAIGMGTLLAGSLIAVAGTAYEPDPVSSADLRGVIDRYNRSHDPPPVPGDGGVRNPATTPPAVPRAAAALHLGMAPTVSPRTAGIAIQGTF